PAPASLPPACGPRAARSASGASAPAARLRASRPHLSPGGRGDWSAASLQRAEGPGNRWCSPVGCSQGWAVGAGLASLSSRVVDRFLLVTGKERKSCARLYFAFRVQPGSVELFEEPHVGKRILA